MWPQLSASCCNLYLNLYWQEKAESLWQVGWVELPQSPCERHSAVERQQLIRRLETVERRDQMKKTDLFLYFSTWSMSPIQPHQQICHIHWEWTLSPCTSMTPWNANEPSNLQMISEMLERCFLKKPHRQNATWEWVFSIEWSYISSPVILMNVLFLVLFLSSDLLNLHCNQLPSIRHKIARVVLTTECLLISIQLLKLDLRWHRM